VLICATNLVLWDFLDRTFKINNMLCLQYAEMFKSHHLRQILVSANN
jgi:hypothetical protein